MAKKIDGRTVRGAKRRKAWALVATWCDVGSTRLALLDPLTVETLLKIRDYARRRAKGLQGPPPGGVGRTR